MDQGDKVGSVINFPQEFSALGLAQWSLTV
jgi:hypothetical protein